MADYMLVFMPQKILSLLGLLGQNIILLCHYAQQKSHRTNHFRLLLHLSSPTSSQLSQPCEDTPTQSLKAVKTEGASWTEYRTCCYLCWSIFLFSFHVLTSKLY